MKKSLISSTPKPLPGQHSYNVSETEALERDTKAMQDRLVNFQASMKEEANRSAPSGGSSKWKSASKEKGSLTG